MRIKDVAMIQAGTGFPEQYQGKRNLDYGFYKVKDISKAWLNRSDYLLEPEHEITKKTAEELNGAVIPPQSVVFAKIGEALKLNRRALTGQACLVDNNVFAIIPDVDKVIPKFLYYYSRTIDLSKLCRATTVPSLRKGDIEEIEIPDFNKNVQLKIIQALDTQFTRLDAAIKSLKAIKAKLELYRKSVLKVAFDKDWQLDKLGNLFETTSGGTPSRSNKKYYTGMIPWLKSGELNDNRNIEDSEEHVTQEAIKNSSAKKFPANTILIALYGATTGKLGILRKESTTNQAVCGVFPHKEYLPEFVFYFLLSRRTFLISQGKGGAQPNISQGIVRDTDFPRADKKTQQEIIDFIKSQLSVIDKVKIVIDASLIRAERLRKSILKSAFEGKLVN